MTGIQALPRQRDKSESKLGESVRDAWEQPGAQGLVNSKR